MNIAIVGTGYVGLVSGTCFAEMGVDVTCVDVNREKINGLLEGNIPIYEPGLEEMVLRNSKEGRLHFTTDLASCLDNVDIVFSAVGTPPDEDGSADLRYVLEVARTFGQHIKKYTVLVTKSTVPVGTARKVKAAIQEELSKRGMDIPFDVASNPEFLKEGAAIKDFMSPDRVVVGVESERARKLMAKLYKTTPLEDSFSCNFNILIAGMPRVMGVGQILEEWAAWRTDCVKRRVYFILNRKKEKLHLLQGLKRILLDIDRAIRIIRETEEESEVIPNLMIGFGIDQVQAEYVAEIKLRNINKEYILKRVAETAALQDEIEDLEDTLSKPGRIRKIIIGELEDVKKKYAVPRRTEIVYSHELPEEDEEDAPEDYPVHLFLSREGYFKKITPQSLRMSGEQKFKEGDELAQTVVTDNAKELLFFTNRCQVYKARVNDFKETKASALGDYVASTLDMDEGETAVYMVVTSDYSGHMLFFFENGKAAKVELSAYQTKTNRKKLIKAYSDKSPVAAMLHIESDVELVIISSAGRHLLINTGAISPKTTKDTQGVGVMSLKKGQKVMTVRAYKEGEFAKAYRYKTKNLPAAGALLSAEDKGEQLELGI